jgi:hypothetical protein
MKVLLIGNGGREHALAWKLAQSPRVTALYALPGNPGTAQFADNVPIDVMNFDKIEKFIKQNDIGFVVIGPEDPLAAGIGRPHSRHGRQSLRPQSRDGARIEADKWFAKEIMRHQSIPTAEARSFTDLAAAEEFLKARDEPVVVKAAGLAKGKGVTVCYRTADAIEAVNLAMRKKVFGDAGTRVVIEELLKGRSVRFSRLSIAVRSTSWKRRRITSLLTTATPSAVPSAFSHGIIFRRRRPGDFDRVVVVGFVQPLEVLHAAFVFGPPFLGELAAGDLGENLLHLRLGLSFTTRGPRVRSPYSAVLLMLYRM